MGGSAAGAIVPIINGAAALALAASQEMEPIEKAYCPHLDECPAMNLDVLKPYKSPWGCVVMKVKKMEDYHQCRIANELEDGLTPKEIMDKVKKGIY